MNHNTIRFGDIIKLFKSVFFRLRKDLRRTKALLKDAQATMERSKTESSTKVVMRQLRNQVSSENIKLTFFI
jgi:hypothetical protein